MKQLRIQLKTNSYNIFIEDDILFHLSFYIKEVYQNHKIYIITDDNVEKLYLETVKNSLKDYEVESIVIPHGEASKSIEVYTKVVKVVKPFFISSMRTAWICGLCSDFRTSCGFHQVTLRLCGIVCTPHSASTSIFSWVRT